MMHDKALVTEKLRKWERFLQEYALPTWDMLPGIDLYMDQVIVLLTQYLNFLPREDGGENVTTPAMINNYVKMKVLPPPRKETLFPGAFGLFDHRMHAQADAWYCPCAADPALRCKRRKGACSLRCVCTHAQGGIYDVCNASACSRYTRAALC